MSELGPLETLYESDRGADIPLPRPLSALYGRLRLPSGSSQPYIIGNFATTLDGVVSLSASGHSGGGEITGFNPHDRMVMGLLRAIADVVIVGAGTLRAVPQHRWTASHAYPNLADAYREMRRGLDKTDTPLNVIVTASGELDLTLPVFHSGEVRVLIVTTAEGAQRVSAHGLPPSVQVAGLESPGHLRAAAILEEVARVSKSDVILVEGGPRLMGDFLGEGRLDELFLTLAPQIAGRTAGMERPGLVAGKTFAPEHPLWGSLTGVKRAGDLLFLRFTFASTDKNPIAPSTEPPRRGAGASASTLRSQPTLQSPELEGKTGPRPRFPGAEIVRSTVMQCFGNGAANTGRGRSGYTAKVVAGGHARIHRDPGT